MLVSTFKNRICVVPWSSPGDFGGCIGKITVALNFAAFEVVSSGLYHFFFSQYMKQLIDQ